MANLSVGLLCNTFLLIIRRFLVKRFFEQQFFNRKNEKFTATTGIILVIVH